MQQIFPGIWKLTLGAPEAVSPVSLRNRPPAAELATLPAPAEPPIAAEAIRGKQTPRGYVCALPLGAEEQPFGLGLQLLSFNQRGKKKTLRVNSDPRADLGDAHAPVPFYVTTAGYGVLIDTLRYVTFYFGAAKPFIPDAGVTVAEATAVENATELYAARAASGGQQVLVEIPSAAGVDVYIFAGPSLSDAVQRYNRFAGGGCLPPRWGLGNWYRTRGDFSQEQALQFARDFRSDAIPCDVLGLEPGWQSHTYPCTFTWSDKFPDPAGFFAAMQVEQFRVNLWTHLFVSPDSPVYPDLLPFAGDYTAFDGLVPDLSQPAAREIVSDFYAKTHVEIGASGYKLDECDNSDFISQNWSFPEITHFPSGLDGEQMHSLLGMQYQETVDRIFRARNQRAYHEVRSAHALAAPYPFVLYSDLYDHKDFLRGVVNAGFSGLLWCPEVRHADSAEDLIRRLQSVALSPQSLINAWYIKNAPWKQWITARNNADQFAENYPEVEAICRDILSLRMQLLPYLYAAFYRYATEGLPPFRALVMDYPADPATWSIDDQWLVGDRLLVAPVVAGAPAREVYLPAGPWHDFWTGTALAGGSKLTITAPLERIPLFVKGGAVLPLAAPTLSTDDPESYELTVRVYGDGHLPITLIEDDGLTFAYQQGALNRLTLSWQNGAGQAARDGDADVPRYLLDDWVQMG